MRGYLRSPGHMYYLDTDVTSVGRGSGLKPPDQLKNVGAHIPLGSGKVEHFHAVVEKRAQENCFILVDMNTAYGTYVNEHRIQNGAVRLAPGDVVRFGHGGIPHEFNLVMEDKDEDGKNSSRTSSASGKKKQIESGYFDTSRSHIARNQSAHSPSSPLPFNINLRPDTAPTTPRVVTPPLSKLVLSERSKSVPLNLKMAGPGRSSQEEKQEAWRSSESEEYGDRSENKQTSEKEADSDPWYVSMLREKEQRLLHMGDEIMRLSVLEGECKRKDGVISELRGKLNHSEQSLMEMKSNSNVAEKDRKLVEMGDEISRLAVYERECERKDRLVATLRDQVAKLEIDKQIWIMDSQRSSTPTTNGTNHKESMEDEKSVKQDVGERFEMKLSSIDDSLLSAREHLDQIRTEHDLPVPDRRSQEEIIFDLKDELEEKEKLLEETKQKLEDTRKELNLSSGLVQSLQRNGHSREQKIKKVTAQLEKSKQDYHEAKEQIHALSNKIANLREEKKHEGIVGAMEKELNEMNSLLQVAQTTNVRQQEKLEKQARDLKKCHRQNKQFIESGRTSQRQIDEFQKELSDLQRKEQSARVISEQTGSKYERLRSRVVQAVFTAPGSTKPENSLADAEVLKSIQKIIDDRSEFHQQLVDLGHSPPPLVVAMEVPEEENPLVASDSSIGEKKKQGKKTGKR
uniref:coiled-coil domain-containing protein 27 n=1 Tax=Ciona intestinalis TaxID=7719 RepID=UPI00089DD209|nr:coiled-coil domain-containing protein 27 [Ciona intestinalis]|eukprot:XP_004225891.2 coiled-coil domain-containing protein 27 [Ciona intestinalis]